MSDKRTRRLSPAVVGLWIVVDSFRRSAGSATALDLPEEVRKVALAVERITKPPKPDERRAYRPKVRLNRSLAALRRNHSDLFRRVHAWLLQSEVHALFIRKGHAPTWYRWSKGAARIQLGERPSDALGLEKRGRPHESSFSIYHDAALYAEYLTQVQHVPSEDATKRAMKLDERMLDRREVQRWRSRVRATESRPNPKIEDEDLAMCLREQYNKEYKAMLQQQYDKSIASKYHLK